MRLRSTLLLMSLAAVLVACGNDYFGHSGEDGGGGSNSEAQGIWGGTTSDRYRFQMLVTPNNEVWGFSFDESFNSAYRLWQGTGTQSGQTFSGTGKHFPSGQDAGNAPTSGTLTATVTTRASFNGTLPASLSFNTTYNSQYDGSASLANYTGTWTGQDSTGSPVTITLGADGALSASATVAGRPGSCVINGSLRTAASGKNYATSTVSIASSTNCVSTLSGQTLQGVALRLTDTGTGVQPLLLIGATNSANALAWFAYARRQATAETATGS